MTRIGVALGSGGARGLAHVGVLAVLEREELRPACIVGTSMGAIVGALYAELLDAAAVAAKLREYTGDPEFRATWEPFIRDDDDHENRGRLSELRRHVQRRLLEFRTLTSPSQRGADRLLAPLERLFRTRALEDLALPFAAVAADLRSGETHVFRQGNLPLAIYASSAIPGVFPPLELDGRLLVDGGGPARVPVDVCRSLGPDFVIAVNIPSFDPEKGHYRTGLDVILRSDAITRKRLGELVLRDADFVVRPDVGHFHWASFAAGDRIRRAGEDAMQDAMPELRRLLAEREGPIARLKRTVKGLWSSEGDPPG